MELTYILIGVLVVALPFLLTRLLSARSRERRTVPGATPAGRQVPSRIDGAVRGEVVRLLAQGGKMEAIKLVRDRTGLALAAAKDAVETIGRDEAIVPPARSLAATIRRAQEMSEEVQQLVAKGQKVEAIKLIRERSGLGLKEAKDLVDRLG